MRLDSHGRGNETNQLISMLRGPLILVELCNSGIGEKHEENESETQILSGHKLVESNIYFALDTGKRSWLDKMNNQYKLRVPRSHFNTVEGTSIFSSPILQQRTNLKQVNTKVILGAVSLFQILVTSFTWPSWFLLQPVLPFLPLSLPNFIHPVYKWSWNLLIISLLQLPQLSHLTTTPPSLIFTLQKVDLGPVRRTLCYTRRGMRLRAGPFFLDWTGEANIHNFCNIENLAKREGTNQMINFHDSSFLSFQEHLAPLITPFASTILFRKNFPEIGFLKCPIKYTKLWEVLCLKPSILLGFLLHFWQFLLHFCA